MVCTLPPHILCVKFTEYHKGMEGSVEVQPWPWEHKHVQTLGQRESQGLQALQMQGESPFNTKEDNTEDGMQPCKKWQMSTPMPLWSSLAPTLAIKGDPSHIRFLEDMVFSIARVSSPLCSRKSMALEAAFCSGIPRSSFPQGWP